jgi:hypothetical protein
MYYPEVLYCNKFASLVDEQMSFSIYRPALNEDDRNFYEEILHL